MTNNNLDVTYTVLQCAAVLQACKSRIRCHDEEIKKGGQNKLYLIKEAKCIMQNY